MPLIVDGEFLYTEEDMASMSEYTGIVPAAVDDQQAENIRKDLHVKAGYKL